MSTAVRAAARRARTPLIIAGIVLIAALSIAGYQQNLPHGELDPGSADPQGARAIAVLLHDHGQDVTRRTSTPDAAAHAGGDASTIVVAQPSYLDANSWDMLAHLPSSVRVVLVSPTPGEAARLGAQVSAAGFAGPSTVDPACDLPEARTAGAITVESGEQYDGGEHGRTCYDGLVVTHPGDGGPSVVVIGAPSLLYNSHLGQEGNAALALELLGYGSSVQWIALAGPETGPPVSGVSARDLLPGWVFPVLLQLFLAGVLAALWKSRRLGSPVPEPLPVVVRSAETVEGRARMYRRAKARDRAYAALRAGALAKLLPGLGLGPRPDRRPLVEALSDRSSWPAADVDALLYGPAPEDDSSLVSVADRLDLLVSATLAPPPVRTIDAPPWAAGSQSPTERDDHS